MMSLVFWSKNLNCLNFKLFEENIYGRRPLSPSQLFPDVCHPRAGNNTNSQEFAFICSNKPSDEVHIEFEQILGGAVLQFGGKTKRSESRQES